jgi:hypothetical protein
MTRFGRATGIVVALAATIGLARASSWPLTPHGSAAGVLRLAWTARPERVENCRSLSEEELSKLPAHMRQSVVCEGTTAAYRLEVRRDGSVVLDEIVRGGGWRHDRPLFVSRDIAMAPGDSLVSVRFVRIDSPAPAEAVPAGAGRSDHDEKDDRYSHAIDPDRRRREDEERLHLRGEIAPASLSLEHHLRFAPGRVILVTYDAERRELLTREGP